MNNPFEQPGAFSWCELITTDPDAAHEFYNKLFGWEMQQSPMQGMIYTVLKAGGEDVGGLMGMPPGMPEGTSPQWNSYVTVEDVDASAKLAEELGATITVPPMDVPDVGRLCQLRDPQGASIFMITYVPQMEESPST